MRKLITIGLILCILTVFVSGACAASEKNKNVRISVSLSGYAGAYGTASSEEPSYATTTVYTHSNIGKKGLNIKGVTQAYVSGGSGSCASSGQTLSGYLSR